jgi:subtilase family serine protease
MRFLCGEASGAQRLLFGFAFAPIRRAMTQMMDIHPGPAQDAAQRFLISLDKLDSALRTGASWVGDRFSRADLSACALAPGIKQILFYEGSSDTQILNQMAIDNLAKVLSSSWGWNPADAASDDPIFQQFAAQGQTFVSASGDSGAFNSSTYFFPGADPYVLQVGGTDLTTTGPGGAWSAETAWDQSGGGYVSDTSIPSWQLLPGVVNSANMTSTTLRNSPDVAAESNFDNPTVVNGKFVTGFGGTSFAAPRWAGFLALVNQQSVTNGRGTVGFVNPVLYNLGTNASSTVFHDITSGSNPPTVGDGSGFNAVHGYDLVTGWGSPAGAALIDQLAGPRAR